MFTVSVIMLTYNQDWERTRFTLGSIIDQKGIDFELVIADDGSNNNNFSLVEEYLLRKDFHNYILIPRKNNYGTVRNLYDALDSSSGKYIKTISPGDALVCNDSLKRWVDFLIRNKRDWSICDAIYYAYNSLGQRCLVSKKTNPQNIKPYMNGNDIKCRWNYLIFDDFALGAAIICKRDILKKYLQEILNKVIYTEDSVFRLMMYDKVFPAYFFEYAICYECESGISNKTDDIWKNKLLYDYDMTSKIILETRDDKKINKHIRENIRFSRVSNTILRVLVKAVLQRGKLWYLFNSELKPRKTPLVLDYNMNDLFGNDTIN